MTQLAKRCQSQSVRLARRILPAPGGPMTQLARLDLPMRPWREPRIA